MMPGDLCAGLLLGHWGWMHAPWGLDEKSFEHYQKRDGQIAPSPSLDWKVCRWVVLWPRSQSPMCFISYRNDERDNRGSRQLLTFLVCLHYLLFLVARAEGLSCVLSLALPAAIAPAQVFGVVHAPAAFPLLVARLCHSDPMWGCPVGIQISQICCFTLGGPYIVRIAWMVMSPLLSSAPFGHQIYSKMIRGWRERDGEGE